MDTRSTTDDRVREYVRALRGLESLHRRTATPRHG
jgi:hypothetical protein